MRSSSDISPAYDGQGVWIPPWLHRAKTTKHPSSMATMILLVLFSLLFLVVLTALATNAASDILSKGRNITDGDKLVSAGGTFTLGFFSPGVPNKRYLGIWFSVSEDAVCWVANRDRPLLDDTSGALEITDAGSLLLLDGSGQVVWSSNTTSGAATTPASARLLDSGNLVVLSDDTSSSTAVVLWQSFDHPSNTLLPGMKIGKNLWTGAEWRLTSWRSASDPSSGRYRYTTDARSVPENVVRDDGGVERYRTGPWNGMWFSGIPEMATYSDMFAFELIVSPGEVTYGYVARAGAPLSRLLLTDDGLVQRLVWDAATRAWKNFFQAPRDVCDAFGRCGAFGVCDAGAASTSFCGCARGFSPASPAAWRMRDYSGGFHRNAVLDCAAAGNGTAVAAATADGFLRLQGVKLPDAHNVSVDASVTLEECGARCMANCSCVAYAPMDIRGGGGAGSGCIMWTDGLVDLRLVDGGQDLYLRSARSELGEVKPPNRSSPTARVVGASVSSSVMVVLIILVVLLVIRRHQIRRISATHSIQAIPAPTVPSVQLSSIKAATKDFHENNMIGRGGFGTVYEDILDDGKKVAVKRMIIHSSLTFDQCETGFMREVELMSKLRHGNLNQLLGYCKDGNERLLVYEYMQNKNLSFYIFANDPKLRASLNWERRLEIIRGVAKGVAYLHGELSEEVIHRDLKPSNILLDDKFRSKIADFGTAKIFIEDQTTQTNFQTPGYTAPEFTMQGNLTLKCDVYSFGVVILNVISGPRERTMPPLLPYAWDCWNQHKIKDLLDSAMEEPDFGLLPALEKCVQIGLLCVQQLPDDRPTMSAVVTMLNSDDSEIYPPKMPVFDDSSTGSPSHAVFYDIGAQRDTVDLT